MFFFPQKSSENLAALQWETETQVVVALHFLTYFLFIYFFFFQRNIESLSMRANGGKFIRLYFGKQGSDWLILVFAHPFPLDSRAFIDFAHFISDGKLGAWQTYAGSVI